MEHTWLAYAFDRAASSDEVEARLRRVGDHYRDDVAFDLTRRGYAGERHGALIWEEAEPACRWPFWVDEGALGVASAYVPFGWERVVDESAPERAAVPLARSLAADPARVADLSAPLAMAIHDANAGTLTIVNDAVGVAMLYELRFDGGVVWSNRLGALPLFARMAPRPDPRGWALLAAAGWFIGDTTPIRGVRKVRAGTVIRVGESGEPQVEESGALARLVTPRSADPKETVADAAAQIEALARASASVWQDPPELHLSGGRDSRIAAAAAVAEGVDADFVTFDQFPGEADVARSLAAASPRAMRHRVEALEDASVSGDLRARSLAMHMRFDGLHNTGALRWPRYAPAASPRSALVSGAGGETGHGFYYSSGGAERQTHVSIEKRGVAGPLERLERSARKGHEVAGDAAYGVMRMQSEAVLARGRRLGLEGAPLLDYFYLVDRFANWAGLGNTARKCSPFATPGFIRAAFDLSPEQRLEDLLHRELIERLVPEWSGIGFFEKEDARMPTILRPRLWDAPRDAEVVEEILREPSSWSGLFRPKRMRKLWAEVVSGDGKPQYEQLFQRLVWRVTYDEHLELLGRRAAG